MKHEKPALDADALLERWIDPERTFSCELVALLERYPQLPRAAMGVPENWLETPLWQPLPRDDSPRAAAASTRSEHQA